MIDLMIDLVMKLCSITSRDEYEAFLSEYQQQTRYARENVEVMCRNHLLVKPSRLARNLKWWAVTEEPSEEALCNRSSVP